MSCCTTEGMKLRESMQASCRWCLVHVVEAQTLVRLALGERDLGYGGCRRSACSADSAFRACAQVLKVPMKSMWVRSSSPASVVPAAEAGLLMCCLMAAAST